VVAPAEPLAAALGEPLRAGLPLEAAPPLAGALVAARAAGLLAAGEVAAPVRGLPLAAGEVAAPLRAAVLVGLAARVVAAAAFVDVAQGAREAFDFSSSLPQATASARSPTNTAIGTSATKWCRFIRPSFVVQLLSKYPQRTRNMLWYRLGLQLHNNGGAGGTDDSIVFAAILAPYRTESQLRRASLR